MNKIIKGKGLTDEYLLNDSETIRTKKLSSFDYADPTKAYARSQVYNDEKATYDSLSNQIEIKLQPPSSNPPPPPPPYPGDKK